MNWTEACIYTTTEGADIVCGSLIGLNITGFEIKDPKVLDELLDNKIASWDYIDDEILGLKDCETSVTVYLPQNEQGAELLLLIKEELSALKKRDRDNKLGRLEITLSDITEDDWANNWKQYFKPFKIGERLLIKPSWEEAPKDSENRKILEIDPASSFGTGQHDTTRLCLENIEKYIKQGDRMLDLGCGSGILSIAGFLLGAGEITAVDIDENSVRIAKDNLLKNGIKEDSFRLFCGNVIDDGELRNKVGNAYDIVCANIVSDILIAMSGVFSGFLKQGGILVVSGIISQRKDEVVGVIENCGFILKDLRESKDWISAVFEKTVLG